MESRTPEVKAKIIEVIDSIALFADTILDGDGLYSYSEVKLAYELKMAIIFYEAREE